MVNRLEDELTDAVADANDLISFATVYEPRHTGMATTLTAVAMANDSRYLIANVGDSRTYVFRDGRLAQLTRDDSLMRELIDQGDLTASEARGHPHRSVVLKALNGEDRQPVVLRVVDARAGDRLLLCSDGVTDYLSDGQLAGFLGRADAGAAARQLVDAAPAVGSSAI
ncbi:MAG TPA: protein phosphatase 2C domain-containing protein [Solirubrobacteraceae bacterium]|nr:protein phosphatase 2C domain-containing protein [Solirubrobacteraceae bacterium]